MASDSGYKKGRKRWTWRNQTMEDETTKVLSSVKKQSKDGCAYFAVEAVLESNHRVQKKKNVLFSIHHLQKLCDESKSKMPNHRGMMKRILLILQNEGVFTAEDYENIHKGKLRENRAQRCRLKRFQSYFVDKPESIHHALYQLRRGGPLLAVIRISKNYDDCRESGHIYRFDPSKVVKDKATNQPVTHAVCVVAFAIEEQVPCFECQDSQGLGFGRRGFVMVDITSLKELYSIKIQ